MFLFLIHLYSGLASLMLLNILQRQVLATQISSTLGILLHFGTPSQTSNLALLKQQLGHAAHRSDLCYNSPQFKTMVQLKNTVK